MLVRSLLLAGALINDTDNHRNTALHAAAKAGQAIVVSALLQVYEIKVFFSKYILLWFLFYKNKSHFTCRII